jgi:hypothetical protein
MGVYKNNILNIPKERTFQNNVRLFNPEFTTQCNVHPKIMYLLAVPDIVRYFGSRL